MNTIINNENVKPEENINYLFWKLKKQWEKNKQKTLNEFSITGPQLEVLGTIKELSSVNKGKEIKQIDISRALESDPMTTSTILRNLQKKRIHRQKGE